MKTTANNPTPPTDTLHFMLKTDHNGTYEFAIPLEPDEWSILKRYADKDGVDMGTLLSRYLEMGLASAVHDGRIFYRYD